MFRLEFLFSSVVSSRRLSPSGATKRRGTVSSGLVFRGPARTC